MRPNISGNSIQLKIVSLGITSLFFKKAIFNSIVLPVRLCLSFYTALFSYSTPLNDSEDFAMNIVFIRMKQLFYDISLSFSAFLSNLEVVNILLAVSLFILLSRLLNNQFNYADAASAESKTDSKHQKAVTLGLIILTGLYLSIVSIVVIPYFKESKDVGDFTPARLQKEMDEIKSMYAASFNQQLVPDFTKDTVYTFNKAKADSVLTIGEKAEYLSRLNERLDYLANQANNNISIAAKKFKDFEEDIKQKTEALYKLTILKYGSNSLRLKSSEVQDYYDIVLSSYNYNMVNANSMYNAQYGSLLQQDKYYK
ncbi:MAG TPA: hypothetical protein VG961_13390, partial [Ignavibacteria bacterium]|nr:hypothetical protein [Ignavibacteria bacterium]